MGIFRERASGAGRRRRRLVGALAALVSVLVAAVVIIAFAGADDGDETSSAETVRSEAVGSEEEEGTAVSEGSDPESEDETAEQGAAGESSADEQQAAELAESTEQLQRIVDEATATSGGEIAVILTDLSSGATAESGNSDEEFVSASIYKLYVAFGIYRLADAGSLALDESLAPYGVQMTVENCLDAMITVSDNTCGVALGSRYGWAELDALLAEEGYSGTSLNNYSASGALVSDKQTTASDTALLLQRLYDGDLLETGSTDAFIALLAASEIDYMLPSGLPAGTVIAHKVGFLGEYQHDAGIIFGADRDLLVVMLSRGWQTDPESEAAAAFGSVAGEAWAYLEERAAG